jgi:hypothetical protein
MERRARETIAWRVARYEVLSIRLNYTVLCGIDGAPAHWANSELRAKVASFFFSISPTSVLIVTTVWYTMRAVSGLNWVERV